MKVPELIASMGRPAMFYVGPLCVLAAMMVPIASASAEGELSEVLENITIADASMGPAKAGDVVDVFLRIENEGSKTVRIEWAGAESGEQATFDYHARGGSIHGPSFSIGPGESVAFAGGRARLTVGPLKRDLSEGDVLNMTFTFDPGWSTSVPVHVHAALQTSSIASGATPHDDR